MENFAKLLREFDVLIKDPESFIFNVTQDAIRKVDLKKENLIHQLDVSSDNVVKKIKVFKNLCVENLKNETYTDCKVFFQDSLYTLQIFFDELEKNPSVSLRNLELQTNRCKNFINTVKRIFLNNKNFTLNWKDAHINLKQHAK